MYLLYRPINIHHVFSTATVNIDYADTYFQYPIPVLINGKTYVQDRTNTQNKLRANGSSVDTCLGGSIMDNLDLYKRIRSFCK